MITSLNESKGTLPLLLSKESLRTKKSGKDVKRNIILRKFQHLAKERLSQVMEMIDEEFSKRKPNVYKNLNKKEILIKINNENGGTSEIIKINNKNGDKEYPTKKDVFGSSLVNELFMNKSEGYRDYALGKRDNIDDKMLEKLELSEIDEIKISTIFNIAKITKNIPNILDNENIAKYVEELKANISNNKYGKIDIVASRYACFLKILLNGEIELLDEDQKIELLDEDHEIELLDEDQKIPEKYIN